MVASFESRNDNKGEQGVNEQKVDDSLCFSLACTGSGPKRPWLIEAECDELAWVWGPWGYIAHKILGGSQMGLGYITFLFCWIPRK